MALRIGAIEQLLHNTGTDGLTWKEVGRITQTDHGVASGALSGSYKKGTAMRLAGKKRDNCAVYVHPEFVGSRETVPYIRRVLGTDSSEDAYDRGYMQGVSEGSPEARETAYRIGYRNGWDDGQALLRSQVSRFLGEATRAIHATFGLAGGVPTTRSWMTTPTHTIAAIKKHLDASASRPAPHPPMDTIDLTAERENRRGNSQP